jgi:hypothetical protein
MKNSKKDSPVSTPSSPVAHRLSCLILLVSKELLTNGLESLLKETVDSCKYPLSFQQFIRLVLIALTSQKADICPTIQRLKGKYRFLHGSLTSCINNSFDNFSSLSSSLSTSSSVLNYCSVSCDPVEGRKLLSNQAVSDGISLVKESSYVSVVSSVCGCREENLLIEHLEIAKTIWKNCKKNENKYGYFIKHFYNGLSVLRSEYDNSTEENELDSERFSKKERQADYQGAGRNHVNLASSWKDAERVYTTTPDHQTSTNSRGSGLIWSFSKICLFGVISCVTVMFQTELEGNDDNPIMMDTREKEETASLCEEGPFQFFQILTRIPLNTHGITRLEEDPVSHSIESVRIGYSLFLLASSINHSCSPNAIIRYNHLEGGPGAMELKARITVKEGRKDANRAARAGNHEKLQGGSSFEVERNNGNGSFWSRVSDQEQLEYLSKTQIEVLSTSSIPRNEEITVSYGPLIKRHSLSFRQKILEMQYLFICHCPGCEKEKLKQQQPLLSVDEALVYGAGYENSVGKEKESQKQQQQYKLQPQKISIEKVKDLCYELNDIKQQLLQANIALTELITSSKEKENYYLSLEQFEKAALTDVGKKLLFLLSSHYSNECKTFSQEIFPYQMINVLTKLNKSYKKKKTMELMTLFSFHDCKTTSDNPSLLILSENPLFVELIGNYCFFLDISSHLKAEMNQLAVSLQILWEMISWMIFVNIYSENSIEISREFSKLASLYFNIGQFVIAYNLALKAYSLLEKYCSSSDHDKEEMEQIIVYYQRMICKVTK